MTHRTVSRTERGSIMVLVMIILVALLAGGAVLLTLQSSASKQVGIVSKDRAALFCAEAGLSDARTVLGANYAVWNDILDGNPANDPAWYPLRRDIDDPPDGVFDYEVVIVDNDDEPPPANDPTQDNDLRVFVISRCIKYAEYPREVMEMLVYQAGGQNYRNQSGQGVGNTGNAN